MEKTVFADAMVKVQLINGVVRMELVELQGADTAEAGNKTTPVPTIQLIMPLNGFLRMHEQISNAVEQMVQKGMLKRQDPAQTGAPPALLADAKTEK